MMTETMRDVLNPGATLSDPTFPWAPEDWARDEAETIARTENLDLTEDHWQTIKALQGYFNRVERPNIRELHDALDEAFHAKGGIKFLYRIFPGGPVAQGCRLAGLPLPVGSEDPSFGSVQ